MSIRDELIATEGITELRNLFMGEYMGNVVRRLIEGREKARKEREARVETSVPRQVSWRQARNAKKDSEAKEG